MKILSYITVVIVFTTFSGCSAVTQKEPEAYTCGPSCKNKPLQFFQYQPQLQNRIKQEKQLELTTIYWKQYETGMKRIDPKISSIDVDYRDVDNPKVKHTQNISSRNDYIDDSISLTGTLFEALGCASILLFTLGQGGSSC